MVDLWSFCYPDPWWLPAGGEQSVSGGQYSILNTSPKGILQMNAVQALKFSGSLTKFT